MANNSGRFSDTQDTSSARGEQKAMSDEERLQAEITKIEKDIEGVYKEIGRLYYEQHAGEQQADEMGRFFSQVADAQQKIEECRTEILRAQGHKKCPGCGGVIPLYALFCNICGQKQSPLSISSENICRNCGAPMEEGQLFCIRCGQKAGTTRIEPARAEPVKAEPVKEEPVQAEPVKEEPVQAEPVQAEPVKEEPVQAEPAKIKAKPVCSRCGAELLPGTLFCEQCGQKIESGAAGFGSSAEEIAGIEKEYTQSPVQAAQNENTPSIDLSAENSGDLPMPEWQRAYAADNAAAGASAQNNDLTGEPSWFAPLPETAALDGLQGSSGQNDGQPAAQNAAKIVPEARFCTECGSRLGAGEMYCTNCGKRV